MSSGKAPPENQADIGHESSQRSSESPPAVPRTVSQTSDTEKYLLSNGTIKWINNIQDKGRPFMRVTSKASPKDVTNMMLSRWNLEPPRIVVPVISDPSSLKEWTNTRILETFTKGLMNAAASTTMWILTNGLSIGISKQIGDAVRSQVAEIAHLSNSKYFSNTRESKITIIGIVKESFIKNKKLIGEGFKLKYEIANHEITGNDPENDLYELNQNHTHFIFVNEKSTEKDIHYFKMRLLSYWFQRTASDLVDDSSMEEMNSPGEMDREIKTPIVSIVVQGDMGTSKLVRHHIGNKLPVLVLQGSGGFADILSYAMEEILTHCMDINYMDNDMLSKISENMIPEIKRKIVRRFPIMNKSQNEVEKFADHIMECVKNSSRKHKHYIRIFNVHQATINLENLTEHLLNTLLASQQAGEGSELSRNLLINNLFLAIDWNCPIFAKNEIFKRDTQTILPSQFKIFNMALTQPDREEFVDIFLENSFPLRKFLTADKLTQLFKSAFDESDFFKSVVCERVLGHTHSSVQKFIDNELNWLIERVCDLKHLAIPIILDYNASNKVVEENDVLPAERRALAIVSIWAVFCNRQRLAKILWKHCDHPVHLGLILSIIYNRLSWYVDENAFDEMQKASKMFMECALGVYDMCHNESSDRAIDLLNEENPIWEFKTAVDIAAGSRILKLISHPCTQKWLSKKFFGRIRIRDLRWGFVGIPLSVKILLCALLILPMYIWVRFTKDESTGLVEDDKDKDDEDEKKDKEQKEKKEKKENKDDSLQYGKLKAEPESRFNLHEKIEKQGKNALKMLNLDTDIGRRLRFYYRETILQQDYSLFTMIKLMWSAPITKFWTFQFFYIFFLAFFSLAVIYPACGMWYLDTFVFVWTAVIVFEYIRRNYVFYLKYSQLPMAFKLIEITCQAVYLMIFGVQRVAGIIIITPYSMKVLMSLMLLFYYYRLFAVYMPISSTLGPLLYKLKLMVVVDFVNFIKMSTLIIISSGIVIQTVLYPDSELDWTVLRKTAHRSFFSLFLTPIDELAEVEDCDRFIVADDVDRCFVTGKYNDTSCPNTGFWPYVFTIQYFILLKLILLTVLGAMFYATAAKVDDDTDNIWKFQRFNLVIDFANRLPLCAPLSIIYYVYFFFRFFYRIVTCYYTPSINPLQIANPKNIVETIVFYLEKQKKKHKCKLSAEDYKFWSFLAKKYFNHQRKEDEEKERPKKEWESVMRIGEEIEYERGLLDHIKSKVNQLERMTTTVKGKVNQILENVRK